MKLAPKAEARGALPADTAAIAHPDRPARPHSPGADRAALGLRLALFSGNYNCIRDGANKALNRLVAHLIDRGAAVRVYSPTAPVPAFEPAGDLVSVPSLAIPGRPEYRLATGLPRAIRADIERFAPTAFHLSAPDILGTRAQTFARRLGVPVVASLHTRFETYFSYYGLGFLRPLAERHLRRFYRRSDVVLAPNRPIAEELCTAGWSGNVRIWGRGVDRHLFNSGRRDLEWRRAHGFAEDDTVILFFGRLVVEKGLDKFEAAVRLLRAEGRDVRPLIVGEGPAAQSFAGQMDNAVFTGHLEGAELARAVASADILVNPSVTEAFGNVNLEAMAAGLAVVSADVASAQALIEHGRTGLLVEPGDPAAYAREVARLIDDPELRTALGSAAAKAAESYDWTAILDEVIETYRLVGAIPAGIPAGA